MPNLKRVDIMLLRHGIGLPIEVKGQWHQNVWDGSTTQLDEMYAQDWRAKGSGIYLVLWFGEGSCKNLTDTLMERSLRRARPIFGSRWKTDLPKQNDPELTFVLDVS